MRKQIWCQLSTILVMVGIFGCATTTYPPPELQDNKYTNFEYQYSVGILPGWEAHTKPPKDLALIMGTEASKATTLVLINKASKSMIGISNQRLNSKFENYLKASRQGLLKWVNELESYTRESADISLFDYDISLGNLHITQAKIDAGQTSLQPDEYLVVDFRMNVTMGESMVRSKYFMYPCQGDKSCIAVLMVSSSSDSFIGNRSAYDEFVSSFTVNIPKEPVE